MPRHPVDRLTSPFNPVIPQEQAYHDLIDHDLFLRLKLAKHFSFIEMQLALRPLEKHIVGCFYCEEKYRELTARTWDRSSRFNKFRRVTQHILHNHLIDITKPLQEGPDLLTEEDKKIACVDEKSLDIGTAQEHSQSVRDILTRLDGSRQQQSKG